MNNIILALFMAAVSLMAIKPGHAADAPVFTESDLQKYDARSGFDTGEETGWTRPQERSIPRITRELRGRPAVAAPNGYSSGPVDESDPLPEYVPETKEESAPVVP